ncbi:ArdC family protein [Fibrobacter sp. UWH6]|uniref:ArdC family protein n=1 Tax=Fibrobacter sp. (strain UWH6) TaxID=1896212 RepID=UPI0009233A45|nr:zincin-like metallopeptidase domain-containing protein [Fibrobacter sp. UWH6]SHL35866.1 Antirestriction protein ArdC [Fibrobacter sp. UWH6]
MSAIYQTITDSIIKQLEAGVAPWKQPWFSKATIVSYATGRPYSLLNTLLLGRNGEYATWNQIIAAGGKVMKGAKGHRVYFWKPVEKIETDAEGNEVKTLRPMLRAYTVFNIMDCVGILPKWQVKRPDTPEIELADNAEKVITSYINRTGVALRRDAINEAYYSPKRDLVAVPSKNDFSDVARMYGVIFHELVHSTGAENRLKRFGNDASEHMFGSDSYSREELVAELGSAMALGLLGIGNSGSLSQSSAYVASWLKALKSDSALIIKASSLAEAAVKYIFGE